MALVDAQPSRIKSSRRVFPQDPPRHPITTRLSILDATVTRFAPCVAVWLYDEPLLAKSAAASSTTELLTRLEETLAQTLNDYPHFAGQVGWAQPEQFVDHANPRTLARPAVTYGTAHDPGVELIRAEDDRDLATVVPSRQERSTTHKTWIATTQFPHRDIAPQTSLAFESLAEYTGLPGAAVQLTEFRCGGFAVGVKLTHCLSDAHCLIKFMQAWAARTQNLLAGEDGPRVDILKPLFDPEVLYSHAGLVHGKAQPDTAKVQAAHALPMHRFDWWAADAPGYPPWANPPAATLPPEGDPRWQQLSPSTHPPWLTWDLAAPVEHAVLRFSAAEAARIKAAAVATAQHQQRISTQDALLAHVWTAINRARQLQESSKPVYLDFTLGLRARLSPPLGDAFVGSPILLAHLAESGSAACGAPLGAVAGGIREVLGRFTPEAVAAYVHDAACEVSPQRLWQTFLGRHHTLVTSWVRSGAYDVSFGVPAGEGLPRFVLGVMPAMDGLLEIIDVGDTGEYDVSLHLEKDSMERFLSDLALRSYEE